MLQMRNSIYLILILFAQVTYAKSHFVEKCEASYSTDSQFIFKGQIKWLKAIFRIESCSKLKEELQKLNSFTSIIPNFLFKSDLDPDANFKLWEFKPSKLAYSDFKEEWEEAKFLFDDLSLFREFTNITHIFYENVPSDRRTLCETLKQIPSIKSITFSGLELHEQDLECLINHNANIYIAGDYIPNEESYKTKDQIRGIENYLGDINQLPLYRNLTYLGLRNYKGDSNIGVLVGIRNLTRLHLNVKYIENPSDIKYLNSLKYLSLNCYETPNDQSLHNKISCKSRSLQSVDFLQTLPYLKGLDLSWNTIEDINAISKLQSLEHLNLEHNKIENLKPILNLKRLIYLNLKNNSISDLSVFQNRELKDLAVEISNNPIDTSNETLCPKNSPNPSVHSLCNSQL